MAGRTPLRPVGSGVSAGPPDRILVTLWRLLWVPTSGKVSHTFPRARVSSLGPPSPPRGGAGGAAAGFCPHLGRGQEGPQSPSLSPWLPWALPMEVAVALLSTLPPTCPLCGPSQHLHGSAGPSLTDAHPQAGRCWGSPVCHCLGTLSGRSLCVIVCH